MTVSPAIGAALLAYAAATDNRTVTEEAARLALAVRAKRQQSTTTFQVEA